ncbi:MAG: hypothetical protein L6R35_001375 [Caloplaca aegaea]|nr:MAG: hypothetical protein L6R35_001375 [Caloplaca aegaea]
MWNRILGKSNDTEKNPSMPDGRRRRHDNHRSTPRRSESLKSTTSSRKGTRDEYHDRGFSPISTSYSSTTRHQYPGTAPASVGTSFASALSDPTSDQYPPPGLYRNASLADQIPKSTADGNERPVDLGPSSRSKKEQEESSSMDQRRTRKERRGTRDRDDNKRDKKSKRDGKGGKERAMSIDDGAYAERSASGRATSVSDGRTGNSSFVPLDGQYSASRPESVPGQQSSHVQHQFPGQFPASSATPYRPPFAASEGGPGLAAEYYGDAGQSVAEQPGIRTHSPSLIIGAEPHLQAASAVAAPPPEPSASGGVGAAASFFDGSFNAGFDIEDHNGSIPALTNKVSQTQYDSAAPVTSSYATNDPNKTNQHSSSAPVVPTVGAAAGYYLSIHHSRPERPVHHTSSMSSGSGPVAGTSSHQHSLPAHDQNTMYSTSTQPQARPGKQPSTSSNIPLYVAGAAGLAAAGQHNSHHHNDHEHHQNTNHGSALYNSHSQHHTGGSIAQQHRHRDRGPLSTLVDFFKDPDGVAQFEEYTEFIGVCRRCFAPGSSPRDAPRRHNYRRRRSDERLGSSVRVDKDSRYWSSENERRKRKNKSWLGAGIAGYGLASVGESLFKPDHDFQDSQTVHSGRVRRSHRRGSSSSPERRSRTSRVVVNRSSGTLSHRSRSDDGVESGITSDGKLYRNDSHGHVYTPTVKADTSHRRSRSRSRDRTNKASKAALGAAVASTMYASTSHRRGSSPEKSLVNLNDDGGSRSELTSVVRRGDSQHHDGQRRSHHSPDLSHRRNRRKEKKSRGFFTFSNESSSSAGSSSLAFGAHHQRKPVKETKSHRKGNSSREADAALLGLGTAAAALALNQNQRSRHKGELVAVKESRGKVKHGKNERKGKRSSSSSEEDLWESASEGEWSSADSELAYGALLHRRSQESLSSDSSGMDKWSWRWGSKKQPRKRTGDRRHYPGFDHISPAAAAPDMDVPRVSRDGNRQDSRVASSSSIPLQHVYPMPTSDPTQFDVSRHDAEFPSHQPYVNARPDPVPMQHPQPIAPVSPAVYTTQGHNAHSYSAPVGPISLPQYPHPSMAAHGTAIHAQSRDQVPGAFPTGSEYFGSFVQESQRDARPRRRDSSPVTHTSSSIPRRRKSLKDDSSSVRFDLTKEQEDKDRRDERRRRTEDGKRRERLERQELEDRNSAEQEWAAKHESSTKIRSDPDTREDSATVKKESWAAPAAAGVIAAAIGATVVAKARASGEDERSDRNDKPRKHDEERDIEVIVKERHAPAKNTAPEEDEGRGRSSEKKPMSVWQAAAKIKRTSSHTDYAAYFTPSELLTKSDDVRQMVGANADNDITVYQVPNVVIVEPSELRGQSPAHAYTFPIKAEDMGHRKKPLPWSVPQLNLVEATPPHSRSASVAGSRSPTSQSPLSKEIPIDIPLEPLESLTDNDITFTRPHDIEYTVIEPKDRSTPSVESPIDETDLDEAVPGISSLRNRSKRNQSPAKADYGDDLDFAATVAAGLEDTGLNPSIVIDDPSFRRRDSPPGSEGDNFARSPTVVVTEIAPDVPDLRSPPHGFVEEISERHMPGSFDEDEEQLVRPRPELTNAARSMEEATAPADNVGAKPHVHSIEPVLTEPWAASNAAVDPSQDDPYKNRKVAKRESVGEERTQPSDNTPVNSDIYTAEPQSFESEKARDVTIDPSIADWQPLSTPDRYARGQPLVEEATYSSPDKVDDHSDDARSVAASAPVVSTSSENSKSKKKSKRRSVGFEDTASIISAPTTFEDTPKERGTPEKGRKSGIFGMFSRSTESLPEPKGSRETPVEANLEDFEEPKKRSKKSKSRKATWEEEAEAAAAEPTVTQEPEAQDDWSTSKKWKRGKEKRRSSEQDSGRITHDLPTEVIAPAFPHLSPSPSDEMLTNLEDPKADRNRNSSGPGVDIAEIPERSPTYDDQEQSFLGERPEKPPLPDLPDASEDPGGQFSLEHSTLAEGDLPPLESHTESPATKADKQKWRLSDIQSDGRSVSYSSPSPTAVPLRPLRFGRRPSSPSLAKSLPSTPQASATVDLPFAPRRRERPHSTEFKSNEFRPIWLLEKHGSRQEPAPQETYPSLPSSHTTSRASSVHEADDSFEAEALGLAIGESSARGPRGLAIDTSRGMFDSDLLDSQQATPTAASFHSMLQEDSAAAQDSVVEHGWPRANSSGRVAVVDASADPVDETTEERLLPHGLEDIFPQNRSISPSRHVIDVIAESPAQAGAEALRLPEEQKSRDGGLTSTITDAALGAPTGDSAAGLSRSTSQYDKHPEPSLSKSNEEETSKDGGDLVQKPADDVPGRPTVEETRLMQEQDAQDAVDSWFTPAQPRRSKVKKGKKQSETVDALGLMPTVDTTAEATSSVSGDAHFTEPAETATPLHTESPRGELSPTAVDPAWQAALVTRKDSKGKKKKSKKKPTDSWEDKYVVSDEPTAEPLPSTELPSEEIVEPVEFAIVNEVPDERADAEASQEIAAPPLSLKKSRKGKKKDRQLSLTGLAPEDPKEELTAPQSNERGMSKDFDAIIEHPDLPNNQPTETAPASSIEEAVPYNYPSPKVSQPSEVNELPVELLGAPTVATEAEFSPNRSSSEHVPYAFPSPTGPPSKAPTNSLLVREEPIINDTTHEERPFVVPSEKTSTDLALKDALDGETPIPQLPAPALIAEEVTPIEDVGRGPLPSQQSESTALESPALPKNDPLPVDEDFDLAAPPDSPVILPIDVSHAPGASPTLLESRPKALEQGIELSQDRQNCQPSTSKLLSGIMGPGEPDASPKMLTKAISELNLPESASLDQPAEASQSLLEEKAEQPKEQNRDEWPTFSSNKAKKGRKDRKSKLIETESVPDDADRRPAAARDVLPQVSEDLASSKGLPDDQAVPEKDRSGMEAAGLEQDKRLVKTSEPGKSVGDPIMNLLGEDAEWPTAAKKKKTGKKSKRVQFDEGQDIQPEEIQTPSIPEQLMATTSTAEEVLNLLQSSKSKREPDGAHPTLMFQPELNDPIEENYETITGQTDMEKGQTPQPESLKSVPTLRLEQTEAVPGHQLEVAQKESLADQELVRGDPAVASTETATEVQNMLLGQKILDHSLSFVQDTPASPAQPAEADDFAWGPSKKKNKGKRSKIPGDVANAKIKPLESQQPPTPLEPTSPIPAEVLSSEPLEEFSAKKSIKDKKGKRKGDSRASSKIQAGQESQNSPMTVESTQSEEMAIADNAPSISEKINDLPSIEIPIGPNMARAETLHDALAEQVPELSEKVQYDPGTTQDATFAFSPRPQADASVEHETSDMPEMEITTGAPSVVKRHDKLPNIEMPVSPETVRKDSPSLEADQARSSVAAEEGPMSPIHEIDSLPLDVELPPSPMLVGESLNGFVGDYMDQTDVSVNMVEDLDSSRSLGIKARTDLDAADLPTRDQEIPKDATLGPVADPANLAEESVLPPAVEETSTKSKKDKKKSKKAKAMAWVDDIPEPPTEAIKPLATGPRSAPDTEPAVAESLAVLDEPSKVKKDKKKAKKAEASAWEDDVPETSAEAGEVQRELTNTATHEPPLLIVEKSPLGTQEPLESKKDKKKAKKSKALAWEVDESATSSRNESQQPEGASIRAGAFDRRSNDVTPLQIEESFKDFGEQSTSKKSKNKSKKSNFVGWNDEPSAPSTPADNDEPIAVAADDETVAENTPAVEEVPEEEKAEVLDYLASSKKSKKKGKKSKLVAGDDVPSVPSAPADNEAPIAPAVDQETVAENRPAVEDVPREENADVPDDLASFKKSKKKGKKSKFVGWNDERSVPLSQGQAEQGQVNDAPQEAQEATDVQAPADTKTSEGEQVLAPKAKEDKKTAKKSKGLSQEDEQPVPASQDPDAFHTTTPDLLSKIIEPVDQLQADAAKDPVVECRPDPNVVETQQPPTDPVPYFPPSDQNEAVKEGTPIPPEDFKSEPDNAVATTSDPLVQPAAVDQTAEDASTLQAHRMDVVTEVASAAAADNALKTAEEVNSPLLPPGATYDHLEELDTVRTSAETFAPAGDQLAPSTEALKIAEEILPLPSEETASDQSPLSKNRKDAAVVLNSTPTTADALTPTENQIAPSTDDALKVAEEVIPLPSGETAADQPPLHENVETETVATSFAPTTTDALKSAAENLPSPREDIASVGSDLAKDAPREVADLAPLPEVNDVDVLEDFASTDKKKKAKKAKEGMAWDDEAVAIRQAEQAADEFAIPAEPERDSPATARVLAEESPALGDPGVPENVEAFASWDKKDKKKAKKGKKALAWNDEPSEIITPAEFEPAVEDSSTMDLPSVERNIPAPLDSAVGVEDFPATSKKDKKKAKKSKKTLAWNDEPSETTIPAEPNIAAEVLPAEQSIPAPLDQIEGAEDIFFKSKKAKKGKKALSWEEEAPAEAVAPAELEPAADVLPAEEARVPTPPDSVEGADDFPPTSKKNRKKAKKSKKALSWEEGEPAQAVTAAESEAIPEVVPEDVIVPALEKAEAAGECVFTSKTDKKKAKKSKKSLAFDEDEPFVPTTPAELEAVMETPVAATEGEYVPNQPIEEQAEPNEGEDFPSLSKKDKKKGKKKSKSLVFDEKDSENTTPAETHLEGPTPDTVAVDNPTTPSEPLTAEAVADTLSASKMDQQKLQEDIPLLNVDNEHFESIRPFEADRPVQISAQISEDPIAETSLPVETSTPAEDSASPGKQKKKSKQKKRAIAFDEEPSETTAPAEFDLATQVVDPAMEASALPPEADVVEDIDSPSLSKEEKKKGKKVRKAPSNVENELYGTISPTELQPIMEVVDEGATEPDTRADPSASIDDSPLVERKEKLLAFDEDPVESAEAAAPDPAIEPTDPAEQSILPGEPGTAENDEFLLTSKKNRKKAKRGKKALAFDDIELSGSTTPTTPNPEADVVGSLEELPLPAASMTAAEGFSSVSKKDKGKGEKAKKAFEWEAEDPEATQQVQLAKALDEQLHEQGQPTPAVLELEHADDVDPPAPQVFPLDLATPMTQVERGIADPKIVPEDESTLPTSSKKGKKDKKKAKKAQALDWDDEFAAEPVLVPVPATIKPASATLAQADEDGAPPERTIVEETKDIPDQADTPIPIDDTPAPQIVSELELAPGHERPAAVASPAEHIQRTIPPTTDVSHDRSQIFEGPAAPPPEGGSQSQADIDVSLATQRPSAPSIKIQDWQNREKVATSSVQEAPTSQEEDFASLTTTKKSKKGKKAKKQPIIWEDDTATPPALVQEASSKDGIDAPAPSSSRPEMAAWPTEVRLNQVGGGFVDVQEQLGDLADADALRDHLPEPPAVEDGRDDYFGNTSGHDMVNPPQPYEYEARGERKISPPAPDFRSEGIALKQEKSPELGDVPATVTTEPESTKEEVDQVDIPNEPSRSQDVNVTAEPTDELDDLAPKKKDKKSKRKKKQVVDDVMWEFPSRNLPVPPVVAAPELDYVTPAQDQVGNDQVPGEVLHGEIREAPTAEQQSFVEPEIVTEEGLSRDTASLEHEQVEIPAESQATSQEQAVVPEESHVEETVEDEWGAAPKKSKKGKKSRKTKDAEQGESPPQPTLDTKESDAPIPAGDMPSAGVGGPLHIRREDLGTSEHRPSKDEASKTPLASAGGAMATAAAVGAGLVAAEQLGHKESKKGKKSKKKRQASSTWTEEADGESTPIVDAPAEDNVQERGATPERRRPSPIQAWHQYISPGHSPKRSELYDVEDDRPRSAGSAIRKRSYDTERNERPITPERRSPIAAWHEYNTPGHSPQQSEIYQYSTGDGASSKQFNRDSAVHMMDSPIVSERSPVRRALRDSGYPDTEASPVVGVGGGYQDALREVSQEQRMYENVNLPENTMQPGKSLEDPRDPSPVSSTTKDRSSILFQSSPSTREEHVQQERREMVSRHDEASNSYGLGDRDQTPSPMHTPEENNPGVVNARAGSLAGLNGLGGASQELPRPSLFGGPVGISSDNVMPERPVDDSTNRRRLNTITEYSPEESPLHNRNRDVSDVGAPDHAVKAARRSGTPQAISQRHAGSPSPDQGKGMISTDDLISPLSWPAVDEEKHHVDIERSGSRGAEQRPWSHQSNISSLVSGLPKQREYERRSLSGASNHSVESINAIIRTPPDQMRSASGMSNRSSGTPPLRRSDRSVSGDLRGANRKGDAKKRARQQAEAEAEIIRPAAPQSTPPPPPPPHEPSKERRKSRVKEMADVFEGYGDFHGSPISPTRPPSMRRRQSMQVLELESKLDQLVAENRSLHDARQRAERGLEEAARERGQEIDSYREGIETRDMWIQQKDTEIVELKTTLETLRSQVEHLTEVNQGLHLASRELDDHHERYGQLEEEHEDTYQQWQQSTRELESLKDQHAQLSAGMEDIVRHEVSIAVEEKTAELHRLHSELDTAKQQIRTLQAQILAAKNSASTDSIIPDRDEDYFDAQCQSLCTAVQQWVLRFSKFSDHRACYLTSELRDEKIADRIENAMLDGSDPDAFLADRVRRRDVFTSILMTMAWEYIFTRYLFGADREQRQKLKSLEKQLADSPRSTTPMAAVHRWRATTLALLSRREAFVRQRAQDTEAVMHTIYDTLAAILPPPQHLVAQIQQSLRKVLDKAVDLAVEMRTQRAEYVMLPPLQPEYDTHGDLARLVYFNAALMSERGGGQNNGEELERNRAVVRIVLFPLVVKKGDVDAEEIVVCPAQVLVAPSATGNEEAAAGGREEGKGKGKGKGKSVRVLSAQASDVNMGNNMF